MQLVDAIEAWGQAHRSELDGAELQALADVWRTVDASDFASIDVTSMDKDQARAVMGVFDAESRSGVAATLNKVRKWAIAQSRTADASATEPRPVTPDPRSIGTETVVIDTDSVRPSNAAPSARETVPLAGGGSQGPAGPVEGWEPPTPVDTPSAPIDQRIVLGLIGIVLAAIVIWFVFLRGDDEVDATPVDAEPTVADVVAITNQAFLDQFQLAPEVGECLVAEFGDLAAAATDATRRERQVCGTSLLEIITGAS